MFKRALEVFLLWPVLLILILLNILLVITSVIWGPIYYILTGDDPLREGLIGFEYVTTLYEKFEGFILRK